MLLEIELTIAAYQFAVTSIRLLTANSVIRFTVSLTLKTVDVHLSLRWH